MKPQTLKTLFAVAVCVLSMPLLSAGARAVEFPLHTQGRTIVDGAGQRVRLSMVNWYGAESEDFVVGGLQLNTLANIAAQIRTMGFNAVRVPWSNELVERNPVVAASRLRANPGLRGMHALDLLDRVVDTLAQNGLMVVLDNHNSNAEWCCSLTDGNTLWYNAQFPEAAWLKDWQTMARRYASQPFVIGADLRNEPRGATTWGGDHATDWHAAAERGGNAILAINPHWLIFVEGIAYATDLSGAAALPVALSVPQQLMYSAHNYGFSHPRAASYEEWTRTIEPRWGYLVTGDHPQPLWLGEFGTCNTAPACVSSDAAADSGFWFNMLSRYIRQYSLDWCYWPLNGTQSTGRGRKFGRIETFGVLNKAWNAPSLPALLERLHTLSR